MPLVNVVHGDRLPEAPLNIRVPMWRPPAWLVLLFWLVRGLVRVTVLCVRYWWLTGPTLLVAWAWLRHGPLAVAASVVLVAVLCVAWWRLHRRSWLRFGWYPAVGRWRRVWVYRRRWASAMATTGLAVNFGGDKYIPQLLTVRCDRWADRVTVRMLPGHTPDDWGAAAGRLAYTFRVLAGRAMTGSRPDRVVLVFRRADPLADVVPPLPVPAVPDLSALPLGRTDDGDTYRLRLAGTHVLVAGATGAGKGSVISAILSAVANGIRTGLVEVWAFDPKGGMELAGAAPLFTRFAYQDPDAMAGDLDDAVKTMRRRADRLRGVTRQHLPTPQDPAIVVLVDELAALTAYVGDRKTRDRIREALSLLLSQGRAVGVHVVAALQDPRKEILPFRDLFPTRIALRLTEPEQADLVLGDHARDRGALCDRIPISQPGVGYAVLEGRPEPVRVRFAYLTDTDITTLAAGYRRPGGDP